MSILVALIISLLFVGIQAQDGSQESISFDATPGSLRQTEVLDEEELRPLFQWNEAEHPRRTRQKPTDYVGKSVDALDTFAERVGNFNEIVDMATFLHDEIGFFLGHLAEPPKAATERQETIQKLMSWVSTAPETEESQVRKETPTAKATTGRSLLNLAMEAGGKLVDFLNSDAVHSRPQTRIFDEL